MSSKAGASASVAKPRTRRKIEFEEDDEGVVRSHMLEKLRDSGLDADDAKLLGMEPKMNGTATELTGFSTPGFVIPYFSVAGKITRFWRFRRFPNKPSAPGKKVMKYFQPKGTGVSVYFPPLIKWEKRIQDPTKSIIITEGELKAACATKLGFPTIGLGGVWSFKSKAQEKELIDDLQQIEWHGRAVYICFDSDAVTNSLVMLAECNLCKQLHRAGAIPHIVRMPKLADSAKTGLDDFLMHEKGGVERFKALLKRAEPYAEAAALHDFNTEVIAIRDPGVVIIRETGQRIDVRSMCSMIYANRNYMKATPTDKDPLKRTEKNVAVEWLKWKDRAEASRMTYAPGQGEVTEHGEYNMWKGWGVEPVQGDITPWVKLLDYIFQDSPACDRKWFEQWCAYPLQHPGAKMYTSVVIWSTEQGTGKSLVAYTLGRIYGTNYSEIGDMELAGSFNGWAVNKQFVVGDEITGNNGAEKRGIASRLRNMITQMKIEVNQKYVPQYQIPDCINYMWTSNHCDAFFMDNKDRRYFVVEIQRAPLPGEFYRNEYDPWYKSKEGLGALFYHLLHLDISDFDNRAPALVTDAKLSMIEEGRSDVADWVERITGMHGAKKLMTSEEILLLAQGQGKTATWWTKNFIARAMRAAGYIKAMGTRTPLVLPDGKQVTPWIMDRNYVFKGAGRCRALPQPTARAMWYSERPEPTMEERERKFAAPKVPRTRKQKLAARKEAREEDAKVKYFDVPEGMPLLSKGRVAALKRQIEVEKARTQKYLEREGRKEARAAAREAARRASKIARDRDKARRIRAEMRKREKK